jgi:hypothetical protein
MGGMTARSRWMTGGATYVFSVMALATAAVLAEDGTGFYVAAQVVTIPSYLILYPYFFSAQVLAAMVAGVGVDGSGPGWVLVPLVPLTFGTAAVANVCLLWLVVRGARPCGVRVRRLFSRA